MIDVFMSWFVSMFDPTLTMIKHSFDYTYQMKPSQILVFLYLAVWSDDKCMVDWSVRDIAYACNLSTRQTARILKELEEAHVIQIIRSGGGRGKSNKFKVSTITEFHFHPELLE